MCEKCSFQQTKYGLPKGDIECQTKPLEVFEDDVV